MPAGHAIPFSGTSQHLLNSLFAGDLTREKFYLVGHWPAKHIIYSFSREDGWTPRLTGVEIWKVDFNEL